MRNVRSIQKLAYGVYLLTLNLPFEFMARVRGRLLCAMTGSNYDRLIVRPGVTIVDYRGLRFGRNLSINHNCFISCGGGLTIGDDVSIAHGVTIMTTEHQFTDFGLPMKLQPIKKDSVTIKSDVWIGAKATILAGVTIPRGTIVAAGAVVTKSPESENLIIAGVPAKPIKGRFQ